MALPDWVVVIALCLVSLAVGLVFTRRAGKHGASSYFTGNRSLHNLRRPPVPAVDYKRRTKGF